MRKNLIIIIVLIITIGTINEIVSQLQTNKIKNPIQSNNTSPTSTPSKIKNELVKNGEVKYEDITYRYSYWYSNNVNKVKLIPNYAEKKPALQIMEENSCLAGINGGFYDTNDMPLGLVVSDGLQIFKYKKNSLHNGVVGTTSDSEYYIGDSFDKNFANAVQTGPILIKNFNLLNYSLIRDKPARRSVAIQKNEKEIYFVSIYGAQSFRDGPLLEELPEITNLVTKDLNFQAQAAINMDGGTASAIAYTNESGLEEWQTVGSWWCLKQ